MIYPILNWLPTSFSLHINFYWSVNNYKTFALAFNDYSIFSALWRICMLGGGNAVALTGHVYVRNHFRVEQIISDRNILFPRGTNYCLATREISFWRGRYYFHEEWITSTRKKSFPREKNRFRKEEIVSAREETFSQRRNVSTRKKYFHNKEKFPRGRNYLRPDYWVELITGWMVVVWNIAIGCRHNLCHAETTSSSRKWFLPRGRDISLVEIISSSRKKCLPCENSSRSDSLLTENYIFPIVAEVIHYSRKIISSSLK